MASLVRSTTQRRLFDDRIAPVQLHCTRRWRTAAMYGRPSPYGEVQLDQRVNAMRSEEAKGAERHERARRDAALDHLTRGGQAGGEAGEALGVCVLSRRLLALAA